MSSEIDLDELKRLAREATDIADGKLWLMRIRQMFATGYDERFIIATTPTAVLALVERVEMAEAQVDAASLALNRQPGETLEQAAERAEEEISGLLERSGKVGARAGVLDSQVEALMKRAERAESERDAYKERVALLEGWSKATTKALTGEETTELRMAWTCEKAREVRARALKGLEAYHHGEACPFAFSTRPGNPAEREHAACREWAAALEAK